MSGGTQGRSKHLSLVKEVTRPAAEGRVVSADSLTVEQRNACNRAMRLSAKSGVLVSAMLGEGAWDLRPMFLDQGDLFIVRLSDPGLSMRPDKFFALRDLLHHVSSTTTALLASISAGEANGQVWVCRRFFSQTLQNNSFSDGGGSALHPLQAVQRLVWLVYALHQGGVIHGHLHAGNTALDQDRAIVFDFGFYAHSLSLKPDVNGALELCDGASLDYSADVYGLGVLIRTIMANRLSEQHSALVERMLHVDPKLRPGMNEVAEFFKPESASILGTRGQGVRASSRAGKLIAPPASVPEGLPEPPVPTPSAPLPAPIPPRVAEKAAPHIVQPLSVLSQAAPPQAVLPPVAPALPLAAQTKSAEAPPEAKTVEENLAISIPKHWIKRSSVGFLAAIVIGAAIYLVSGVKLGSSVPYAAYWASNVPSRMYDVAKNAIDDPSGEAALVIIGDAIRGVEHKSVDTAFLRMVFQGEWEESLNRADRELALRLGLMKVSPSDTKQLNFSANSHPALALIIAGTKDVRAAEEELSQMPLSRLADLPSPIGPMFLGLSQLGISVMSDPTARGLAHLVSGDTSIHMVELFFDSPSASQEISSALQQRKLAILLPLLNQDSQFTDSVYEYIRTSGSILALRVQWFETDPFKIWKDTARSQILAIIAGVSSPKPLRFDEYSDLLSFPSKQVRKEAAANLAAKLRRRLDRFLDFVAVGEHQLTRDQVMKLMLVLRYQGDTSHLVVDELIKTQPQPHDMVMLLIVGTDAEGLDALNATIESYLSNLRWDATVDEMRRLTLHRDKLARTLAYARLDSRDPQHVSVLREAAQREQDMATRAYVQQKITSGQEPRIPEPSVEVVVPEANNETPSK